MSKQKTATAPAAPRKRRPWWRVTLKWLSLLLLFAALYGLGLAVITLSLLTPERLTPLAERMATKSLQNCRVEMDRMEIGLRDTYPFFCVNVDGLRVTSTLTRSLADTERSRIPTYADTVLTLNSFRGGINVLSLIAGDLVFNDVTLDGPGANLVVLDAERNTFDIFPPSEEPSEPFKITDLPNIRARRLAITNPRPIRYFDRVTASEALLQFEEVSLDANRAPLYHLRFNGTVDSPVFLEYLQARNVAFGLNGDIEWDQRKPYALSLKNFAIGLSPAGTAHVNLKADFTDGIRVDRFDLDIEPVAVSRIISLLPPDAGVPTDIRTDAVVRMDLRLTEPFDVARDVLPHFVANVEVPDAALRWRDLSLDRMRARLRLTVPDDRLSSVRLDILDLQLRGRATDLSVNGYATQLTGDTYFNGTVTGHCDLSRLPAALRNLIPGTLTGKINADAAMAGRLSMLSRSGFHQLQAGGRLSFENLYWVAPDSVSMVWARNPVVDFGTRRDFVNDEGRNIKLMSATLKIDTATIYHNVLDMHLSDFSLGLGAENRGRMVRRGEIAPLGGKVSVGRFKLTSLVDSAIVRVRNAEGNASIRVHGTELSKPEFGVRLMVNRLVAGDPTTRFSVRDAAVNFTTWPEPQSRRAKAVKSIMDSLRHIHPHLTQDSLIAAALRIHALKHPRRHRKRLVEEPDSTEVFEFYADQGLLRFMEGWHYEGSVSSHRARLFTPFFPTRNRITDLDVTLTNDTISLRGMRYRVGRSDFAVTGKITNLRRALRSKTGRQPLRMNFLLESDTIDVNQLAATVFAGQAYAARVDSLGAEAAAHAAADASDEDMENAIQAAAVTDDNADRPLLIPKNLDAEFNFRANNIIYADMLLNNFTGTALAYDGAVNLNDLTASSAFGSVNLSALYMGRSPSELKFGMGLRLDRFNVARFLHMMPAIDSIMPVLRGLGGIINANIAATTNLTPHMDFNLSSLDAAVSLTGDSLVLLDPDTFKSISKWLLFKNKKRNLIDRMEVQMLIHDNVMELYPFIFNIDRYRLGVQGYNDFNLNFKYHIAVFKSPIPFKFGINISGNPDKYKVRLGGAKFGEKNAVNVALVDSTRINLIREIRNVFRRNIRDGEFARINSSLRRGSGDVRRQTEKDDGPLSAADSARFIEQGLIDAPPAPPVAENPKDKKKHKKDKKKDKKDKKKAKANDQGSRPKEQ